MGEYLCEQSFVWLYSIKKSFLPRKKYVALKSPVEYFFALKMNHFASFSIAIT